MVKVNFLITLEISQMLETIQGALIHEKWLNFIKNNELCGILSCPIANPLSSLPW